MAVDRQDIFEELARRLGARFNEAVTMLPEAVASDEYERRFWCLAAMRAWF